MAGPTIPLADRFWSKVKKTDTCWLWQAQLNNKGYGVFSYYSRKRDGRTPQMYAHRVSWMWANGPIPDGLNVCHKCDNPPCCNPDHLFLGTQLENIRDCRAKGRGAPWVYSHKKLTPDDVRAIRVDPRKHHIIGADYGLKRLAVYNIKARRTWQHVI